MNISDVMTLDTIEIVERVSDMNEAIKLLSAKLKSNGNLNDELLFVKDVLKRESELSTSIGHGIVIPHAVSHTVTANGVAVLKCNEPFKYDNDEVSIIVMLAIASQQVDQHIRVLSQVATKLMDASLRNKLYFAQSEEEILQLFV